MDERYDIIRAVFDGRFRYIRNFEPLKPYYQYMNTPEKGATMREIRRAEKNSNLSQAGKLFSSGIKPVEELYDLAKDPHEINNLASNSQHVSTIKKLREVMFNWQSSIGDVGLIPEAEIEIQEKKSGSRFEIMNGSESDTDQIEKLVSVATKASEGLSALPDLMNASNNFFSSSTKRLFVRATAPCDAKDSTCSAISSLKGMTSPFSLRALISCITPMISFSWFFYGTVKKEFER